ncbi:MAG: respiratory nitrate reductase subunit gamma [Deltaproteobacteria bacterium]|nr:respiratory nitrate reductase subunit gamma [Deltaproteobacteria bacterium]
MGVFTYFAYFFIVFMYSVKIVKYIKLPVHLRWELYPIGHEKKSKYGGSYLEEKDWWQKPRKKNTWKSFFSLLREYFVLSDYAKRNITYWIGIYPWHIGFLLIITFHILCFVSGLLLAKGFDVSSRSLGFGSKFLYYGILITGSISFFSGMIGSIGVLMNRIFRRDLREYATPLNFLTYFFTFLVFFTGFYSWFFTDPEFKEYRIFWAGLVTQDFKDVGFWTMIHILSFDLFLIYLPFTRSLHYITRFLAFFLIRWDDEPNIPGGRLEKKLIRLFEKKVSWSAPHIQKGKKWGELARSIP